MKLTTLYRPVGQPELDLIAASSFKAFPPRLSWQPIFYPVLSEEYAIQIARDWNTKDVENGSVGYVTAFDVESVYLQRFPSKCVGSSAHMELWIPAAMLEDFNRHIIGQIRILHVFRSR